MIRISFFVSMFLLAGCSSNGQVEVVKTPISLEQLSALCKVSTGQYPKTSSTPESIKFPEESGEAVPDSCSGSAITTPTSNNENVAESQSLAKKKMSLPYETNSQEMPPLSDTSAVPYSKDDENQRSTLEGKKPLNETEDSDGLNHNTGKSQQDERAVDNNQIPSNGKTASPLPSDYQSGIAPEDTKPESDMENPSPSGDDGDQPTNPEASPSKSTIIEYNDSYSDNDKSQQPAQPEKNENLNSANFPQAEGINESTGSIELSKEASSSETEQSEIEGSQSKENSLSNNETEDIDSTTPQQIDVNKAQSNVSKKWHLKWKNTDKDNENQKTGNNQ